MSVVIPTTGRPMLRRAVESALAQRTATGEVLIVSDGSTPPTIPALGLTGLDEPSIRLLWTGGGEGAGTARQMGTAAAGRDWIAYLDDDDHWLPDKLATQLDAADRLAGEGLLISCQSYSVAAGRSVVVPEEPYSDGDLAEYLFRKRRLSAGRNLIHTSTLLCSTKLAQSVEWSTQLKRHQDWDFILRCISDFQGRLYQVEAPLVVLGAGSELSISSSGDWRASLEWGRSFRSGWDRSTYGDFVVGQPLRYALLARDLSGVGAVLRELKHAGLPSMRAVVLALSGLVPRKVLVCLMHVRGGPFE